MGARLHYSRPPAVVARPRPEPVKLEELRERNRFYGSVPWRKLRAAFLAENPLCLRCAAEGREGVPATVAHHVVERLDDPDRALDWDNLEALCASCHTNHHNSGRPPR
jgi:5-methylcytosine-specific restriction enzyme A